VQILSSINVLRGSLLSAAVLRHPALTPKATPRPANLSYLGLQRYIPEDKNFYLLIPFFSQVLPSALVTLHTRISGHHPSNNSQLPEDNYIRNDDE
jgi:hypothetical protein